LLHHCKIYLKVSECTTFTSCPKTRASAHRLCIN